MWSLIHLTGCKFSSIRVLNAPSLVFIVLCFSACSHTTNNQADTPDHAQLPFEETVTSHTTPAKSRGERLTIMMCAGCHFNPKHQALSGAQLRDLPRYYGTIYSANITQDETGIAHYSKPELIDLIRHGKLKDGRVSVFMGTPQINDQDVAAIVEFLGSEHSIVRPISYQPPTTKLSWLSKLYFFFRPPGVNKSFDLANPNSNRVEHTKPLTSSETHGKYLVGILECYGCHSKSLALINKLKPELTPGYMAGGAKLIGSKGQAVRSANLTPDLESGIGTWQLEQFNLAMTKGVGPNGKKIKAPMPLYTHLNNFELESIYSYLRTLKPAVNRIIRD